MQHYCEPVMKTCGTCKHFGKLVEEVGSDSGPPDFNYVPNTRFHKCELLEHINAGRPQKLSGAAGVIDGSGYWAVFCVSEEFGCNQHAERTGANP